MTLTNTRQTHTVERVAHFQQLAQGTSDPTLSFSPSNLITHIQDFINRGDAEIHQLRADRRPGRPTSTREDRLAQRKAAETLEFASGFWLPDMANARNVEMLGQWNGEWVALATMGFARVSDSGVVHESSFPPKGMS